MAVGCCTKAKLLPGIDRWLPHSYERVEDTIDTDLKTRVAEKTVLELRKPVETQGQLLVDEMEGKSKSEPVKKRYEN